jgi:hypothetical protein
MGLAVQYSARRMKSHRTLEAAQHIANHELPWTTKLYGPRQQRSCEMRSSGLRFGFHALNHLSGTHRSSV